jgi:hypothetical protein
MTSMNGVTLISGRTDAMAAIPPPAPLRGDDIERVVSCDVWLTRVRMSTLASAWSER